jgi:hypothetical protein
VLESAAMAVMPAATPNLTKSLLSMVVLLLSGMVSCIFIVLVDQGPFYTAIIV